MSEQSAYPTQLFHLLQRELQPTPGRGTLVARHLLSCSLIILISMSLQVPLLALSLVMVFYANQPTLAMTRLVGVLMLLGVTLGVATAILLLRFTYDLPLLRIIGASLVFLVCAFLMRATRLGPIFFCIALITLYVQSLVDLVPTPELLLRACLWAWVAGCYAVVVALLVSEVIHPRKPALPSEPSNSDSTLLAADALTNSAYPRFALKAWLAAMLCYLLYNGLDWPGIHTAMLTCLIVAMPSLAAVQHKILLRVSGCIVGSALALACMVFVMPRLESIVGLLLMSLPVLALGAWIAAGSERIAYAGIQIAFCYALALLESFGPSTDLPVIRDRLIGILLGALVSAVVQTFIWPESGASQIGGDAGN